MRLIDRYLLLELLTPLAYILSGFVICYVAFDLIFHIAQFQEARLEFGDFVKYYAATLPQVLADVVIPVSFLLALLYALTNHSRHHELVAIRAAGVGIWRLAAPYFGVGVALGLATLAINETIAPDAEERARDILESHKSDKDAGSIHFRSDDGVRDWVIDGGINRETGELLLPQVRWLKPQAGDPQRIHAASADFTDGQWVFSNADIWPWNTLASTIETNYRISLPETPDWIRTEVKFAALSRSEAAKRPQLSIAELLTYLRLHQHLSPDQRAIFLTQLQGRMAAPFTCLAVVLIAFPLGARGGRRNVVVGVAGSIFICFAYFVLQRVFFGLGTGGIVPPALAAWLPNILFGATGCFLMTRL